mgnify:CR=1 FL=1
MTATSAAVRCGLGAGVGVGCVVGCVIGFPHGNSATESKRYETELACRDGAVEIDMVINRGAFLAGRYDEVQAEIVAVKRACGPAHLKIILETGELGTLDEVRLASDLAIEAAMTAPFSDSGVTDGEIFIKTSTGKISPAATMSRIRFRTG